MNKTDLQILLDHVNQGTAVLTAGRIHENIPTIHDVSHRDGARLKTDSEVGHFGFGHFEALVGTQNVAFAGGGLMNRTESFSWTVLRANPNQLHVMGYDLAEVKDALVELISQAE